jgi:DNA-binding transcriptional regulator of glucitol operon
MRVFLVVFIVWLLIGALAAWQRHYYAASSANCDGAGTILVTIAFGPVNYFGGNPKLTCH